MFGFTSIILILLFSKYIKDFQKSFTKFSESSTDNSVEIVILLSNKESLNSSTTIFVLIETILILLKSPFKEDKILSLYSRKVFFNL